MVAFSEIEETIARLHKEGKTSKYISGVVHKNYTFIGAVLRKRFPEEYPENNTMNQETHALELFSKSKTPTQVAIKLRWNFEKTEKVYLDFWRLERLYELYRIYMEHKSNLRAFSRFFKQLKDRKITTTKAFNRVLGTVDMNKASDERL